MRTVLHRLAVGAFALSAAVFGLAAPAHADATTGSISGHFTQDGHTVDAYVSLLDSTCNWLANTNTNPLGHAFRFTNIEPGQYKLSFSPYNNPEQYYHAKLSCDDADLVTVTAGAVTTIEETAVPTGTISGHVTDASGAPVPYASVSASGVNSSGYGYGSTDSDGAYQLAVLAGQYTVSFTTPDTYLTQYAHQKIEPDQAETFTVVTGQDTVIDEQFLPTGSMSGVFTDASGMPVEGEQVAAVYASDGSDAGSATTDANGEYRIPALFAGAYQVRFTSPNYVATQWASGKTTRGTADTFTIAAGQDTQVSDHALPTGSIRVTAKDTTTGAPIADFCIETGAYWGCSDSSGQALVDGVLPGTTRIFVFPSDARYLSAYEIPVTVIAGQTTDIEVGLAPGAFITTTIVDSNTGAPVAGACAAPMPVGNAILPDGDAYCADDQGVIHMGPLAAGSYDIFADQHDAYGAQWVGPNGGTGNELTAKIVKVAAGADTTISAIRLDHAGTITGTVTDATGAPVKNAFVGINTQHPAVGGGGIVASTGANGRYTLRGLGPYRWPIVSGGHGYATQWSGGMANRYLATPVTVTAGTTTTYDPVLASGSTLKGTALTGAGVPLTGYVLAYNAVTGDIMGSQWVGSDGVISFPVLGPQLVKIGYQLQDADNNGVDGWYGGADQQHAKVVVIPANGSVTITINTN